MIIANNIKKYENNNPKIINIKKESTSKEYFYIIEV